jgi:hypothetical protein
MYILFYRRFRNHNISTNVFLVNTVWFYSLYWCMGVSSVTTDICHILQRLQEPIWHLVSNISISSKATGCLKLLHPYPFLILDTTLCDKVHQWLAACRWFSPVFSINKIDRHDITEILLKVALTLNKIKKCIFLLFVHWEFIFHLILILEKLEISTLLSKKTAKVT